MLTKKMHPSVRVTVGIAVSTTGLNGPVFFKQTVNSGHYLTMRCFMSHLIATGLPLNTQWFLQDGVTPHTENIVLDFMNVTFLTQK